MHISFLLCGAELKWHTYWGGQNPTLNHPEVPMGSPLRICGSLSCSTFLFKKGFWSPTYWSLIFISYQCIHLILLKYCIISITWSEWIVCRFLSHLLQMENLHMNNSSFLIVIKGCSSSTGWSSAVELWEIACQQKQYKKQPRHPPCCSQHMLFFFKLEEKYFQNFGAESRNIHLHLIYFHSSPFLCNQPRVILNHCDPLETQPITIHCPKYQNSWMSNIW